MTGPSSTIVVRNEWTVRRLSIRCCEGYSLAAGFPPRSLPGDSLISNVIADGEVIRVLKEPLDDNSLKLATKRAKKLREKEAVEAIVA